MFYLLSKTLDLALAPLSWVIGLLAIAAVLGRRERHRSRSMGVLVAAAALLWVAANPMVSNRMWWITERGVPSTHRPELEYDAIILLGGIVPAGRAAAGERPPYGDAVERLLVTYDLLRRDRARVVVISGGGPEARGRSVAEAEVLGRQLEEWGIARGRIVVETGALNTRDNATATRRLIEEQGHTSVLLVTSAFHMQRALGCFRAVGLEPDVLPVDYRAMPPTSMGWAWAPRSAALDQTTGALRELGGRLAYRWMGWSR